MQPIGDLGGRVQPIGDLGGRVQPIGAEVVWGPKSADDFLYSGRFDMRAAARWCFRRTPNLPR
ncbi:hypothetical protein CCANI_03085 [Corynebacterium canis]|nr:hypothetical protein CCANI_03085 [Corynebacterium canis]